MTDSTATVADLEEIVALVESSEFVKALEKHLWFYEASRKSPGMGGVRLSFALESWVELGNKYAPAMRALLQVRGRNEDKLLQGRGVFDDFHDLSAINYYIEDRENTYRVFIHLHQEYPALAKRCYQVIEEMLVEKGAFEICGTYLTNPMERYGFIEKLDVMNERSIETTPDHAKEEFIEYMETSYTEGVCNLIRILIALNRKGDARSVQEKALSYKSNGKIAELI